MSYPSWYVDYRREAFRELEQKSAELDRRFAISRWPAFEHYLEDAELTLSDEPGVCLRASVQVVGAEEPPEWTWSRFEDEAPDADDGADGVGWELAAIVAKLTNAVGVYRPPAGLGAPFLIIRSISALEPAG